MVESGRERELGILALLACAHGVYLRSHRDEDRGSPERGTKARCAAAGRIERAIEAIAAG